MADLKVVIGALLDQSQAKQDLAAQLKKIGNLKVHVETDVDYQELTKYGKFQNRLAQTIQKRAQEQRNIELRQAKAINSVIEKRYRLMQRFSSIANQNLGELQSITGDAKVVGSSSRGVQESLAAAQSLEVKYKELLQTFQSSKFDNSTIERVSDEIQMLQKTYTSVMSKLRKETSYLTDTRQWEDFTARIQAGRDKLASMSDISVSALSFDESSYAKFVELSNAEIRDPVELKKWEASIVELQRAFDKMNASEGKFRESQEKLRQTISNNLKTLEQFTSNSRIAESSNKNIQQALGDAQKIVVTYQEFRKKIDDPLMSEDEFADITQQIREFQKEYTTVVANLRKQTSFLVDSTKWDDFSERIDAGKEKLASIETSLLSKLPYDEANYDRISDLIYSDITNPVELKKWEKNIQAFEASLQQAVVSMQKIQSLRQKLGDSISGRINILEGFASSQGISQSESKRVQQSYANIQKLIAQYEELQKVIQNPMSSESDLDEVAKKIEGLKKSFVEAVRDIKANTKFITDDDEWERFQANLDAAKSKLATFEIKNSAFKSDSDLVSQFAELQNALNGIKDPKALRAWNSEYLAFTERVKAAGKATLSFTDTLKNNISKFTQWFTIGGVVASTTRHIQEMYTQVKALDDSLTELRKVSDLTGASLESFVDKAFALGSEIGRTGQEVIDATTTFKRAGYTLDESLDLAEAALVMTNVGDNIGDTAEAASYLISVLKGFNLSDTDAMKVVDMINETSNNAAIDFDNIAEGLRRVSSTMSQTGTSLSETIGLLTGGFGQLRDIEMVSSGKQEAPYAQKCA